MPTGDEELQRYLDGLTAKVRAKLVATVRAQADELAEAIRAAAPGGETSHLKESVRVERGRHDLEQIVIAGGKPTTTQEVHGPYDYSLAAEFGTQKMSAQPFFWPTYRRKRAGIQRAIADALADALKG